MNTVTDLHTELDALADQAPSDSEVRRTLSHRIERHARRRRSTALIAAAAAVVLVAGGAGVAGAVLSHRSAGPAAPTPVVSVPEVPLPPDTKLIRHHLQPVTAPVTATPPQGLTGTDWTSSPNGLAVSYFHPSRGGASVRGSTADTPLPTTTPSPGSATAGYVVTDSRTGTLVPTVGHLPPTPDNVQHRQITVGGHPATLDTAPEGTLDEFGFPASRRISWRLPHGKWIHVWASGLPGKDALTSFAAGITETPQTLNRTIGIGLTLPGLTVDSSMNSWPTISYIGATVFLCPKGVNPMASTDSSSSGSGSSSPDGTTTSTESTPNPTARCINATAITIPSKQRPIFGATAVTVGDTVAHVDTQRGAAWSDLGNGITAVVGGPTSAHLSAADLAALVASVRLSPAVTVLPPQTAHAQGHGEGGAVAVSAMASPARPPSTAPSESVAGSALPTAPTTIATLGSLTGPAAKPITAPISLKLDDEVWQADWAVTQASGSVSVSLQDQAGQTNRAASLLGLVQYDSAGLVGDLAAPRSATDTTIDAHPAKMWTNDNLTHSTTSPNGPTTSTHGTTIGWTLENGTGVTVTSDTEKQARELAGWITPSDHVVTTGLEPQVTPSGWAVASAATEPGGTATVKVCQSSATASGSGDAPCVRIATVSPGTTWNPPVRPGADWRVATIGGEPTYVSPDGLSVSVALRGRPNTWLGITADASSGLTTADLAEMLGTVPH